MPLPTGPRDYEAQRQWEHWQKQRGIWRYRASLKREVQRGSAKGQMVDRAYADLEPGQRIADETIVPLTNAIRAAQEEALAALENPDLKKVGVDVTNVLLLPAEVIAVVTVQSALSRCQPAQIQGVALDLGGKIMAEVERRAWAAAEKAKAKESLAPDEKPEPPLYILMVRRNKTVDLRVFRKWSTKAAQYVKGGWTPDDRKRVGMKFLNRPFPPQVKDDEFAAMDKDTKSAYMRKRGEIYDFNKSLEGERWQLMRVLDMGQQLATQPVLWFPHTADFRGRFYPTSQDIHTQGDSLLKGLLTFAEGERLGRNGERWLYIALANAMGQDKITLDARADWTANNLTNVIATARDPMGMADWWGNGDSPWEALALALEVGRLCDYRVANGAGSETTFESHIPVRLDATCSGIQHLSALMKDPLSAAAVNVLATLGVRADIYSDVARVAIERIAMDAVSGDVERRAIAQKWMGKVERKTVKRAVMTTPYGVTAPGIKNQLIVDGFCSHFENGAERYAAAEYLKDVVVASLDAKIGAPRTAMEYFQNVAQNLAEREIPLIWTTPSGFTVRQAYVKSDLKRVDTMLGTKLVRFQTAVPDEKGGLDRRKQKSSAAPNVVHSYDAAHLSPRLPQGTLPATVAPVTVGDLRY